MNKNNPQRGKYDSVAKGTKNIEPYPSLTKNDIIDCLGHEDSLKIILAALENRKDADKIFISAILKSWKFWIIILCVSLGASLLMNCLFFCFPGQAKHFIEKSVNSQVPDLLPLPKEN